MDNRTFNASELCSRKLWQMVNRTEGSDVATSELQKAISELTTRKHYLAELARIGKLGDSYHNS